MSAPLDVIIPAYGGTDLTWRCLMHFWLFGPPKSRVVVVDDASPDETPKIGAWLERGKSAIYVRHSENQGCTRSWITGLKATEEDPARYVLFLNNDACVMPGTVPMMLKTAEAGYRIVCAKERNGSIEQGFDPGLYLPQQNVSELKLELGIFQGGCFLIERSLFDETGGFDPNLAHGFGDTDFLLRCRERGVGPVTVEQAVVYHGSSVSSKRMGLQKTMSIYRRDRDAFREKWKEFPAILDEVAMGDLAQSDLLAICQAGWEKGEK